MEAGGEITDELDLIWSNNELELKDKIDAYGHTLIEVDSEETKIKGIQKLTSDKVKAALARLDSIRSKLKARLNKVAENKPLRGHIFSFHPYESAHRTVEYPELLKPEEAYLTIEIKESDWNTLTKDFAELEGGGETGILAPKINFKIKDRKGKVSELPEEHPAVTTKRTPSVMVT